MSVAGGTDILLCLGALFGLIIAVRRRHKGVQVAVTLGPWRAIGLALLAIPVNWVVEVAAAVATPGFKISFWVFHGRGSGSFAPPLALWFGIDYLLCTAAVYGLYAAAIVLWNNEVRFRSGNKEREVKD
jgi:hypothetical protein